VSIFFRKRPSRKMELLYSFPVCPQDRATKCQLFLDKHFVLLRVNPCDALKGEAVAGTMINEADDDIRSMSWVDVKCIASGDAKAHHPAALRDFIQEWKSLILCRNPPAALPSCPVSRQLQVGMTPKKIHEVERMAPIVAAVTTACDTSAVVDLGCGGGFLTQVLSFVQGLRVVGVDCQEDRKLGAEKRAAKFQSFLDSRSRVQDRRHSLHPHVSDSAPSEKTPRAPDRISVATLDTTPSNQTLVNDAVIVGLHTCGNLSSTSFRLFVSSSSPAIVNIGCCYHWLSEAGDDDPSARQKAQNPVVASPRSSPAEDADFGYPMSNFVDSMRFELGFLVRELASHHLEMWATRNPAHHRIHGFRAALQLFFERHLPDRLQDAAPALRGRAIGRMRLRPQDTQGTFLQYGVAVLARLAEPVQDECYAQFEAFAAAFTEADWVLVAVIFGVRQLLGAVVETLILLDRIIYLRENLPSARVAVIPLFDPYLSPRNSAIVALKDPMTVVPDCLVPFLLPNP